MWNYSGDMNLEHGGLFIRLREWKDGYCEVVRVDDLDSACGFTGAVLIESLTVSLNPDRYEDALSVIGGKLLPNGDISDNGNLLAKGTKAWKMRLVEALVCYGYWDTEESEVVQPRPDCGLKFEGWTATRIRSNGLRAYVRRRFLA